MDILRLLFTFIFISFFGIGNAQNQSTLRHKLSQIKGDTLWIDSLSIVPNTFSIKEVPAEHYILDVFKSYLIWLIKPDRDYVECTYRVFPISLEAAFQRRSFDSIFYRYNLPATVFLNSGAKQKPLDFGKLNSAGSIGRTLAFGNRQDGILNSSLNLQLSGYMADSILINAAIADNNIPIQPDGNTQNLNEFDQVFIQFSKDKWKLNLGDLDIRQKELYFLNFYKRLQGVSYEGEHKLGKLNKGNLLASGAVAKGKFTINVFQGVEGNQGPYRLKGANQELFFIVLAGTERVYIDGVLLQRGEDHDYIINYNTAEITFMPNQMISKDKRIQVDFEYADRNYLNSQFFFQEKLELGKTMQVKVGYFGNTDSRNSPINQTLNNSQRQFLSAIGDNSQLSYYPSAERDSFNVSKVQYRKVDTTYGGNKRDTIYVYEKFAGSDLYSLTFSDLGEGNADYIIDEVERANGKVYKWVAPDPVSGKANGRYAPVLLLVTPKQQRLLTIGTTWHNRHGWEINADGALTQFDRNRFSVLNDDDNVGIAGKILLNKLTLLRSKENLELITSAGFEYANAQFKPVERLRTVEFYRDWGLGILVEPADEKIVQASVGLKNKHGLNFLYDAGGYIRGDNFSGIRQKLSYRVMNDRWNINNTLVLTNATDRKFQGYFFRPTLDMSRQLKTLRNQVVGLKYELEKNLSKGISGNTINPLSFEFSNFSIFTHSDNSNPDKWGLRYFTRTDALPNSNKLIKTDKSQNLNLFGELLSGVHHRVKLNATYRKLLPLNQVVGVKYGSSVLGRAEYNTDIWRGAITGSMLYEIGGGQEPQKDYIYFEVPAGQGEYTWIDYNKDGIQQLNEFEVAQFRDEAKFIRLFTPTNSFVRTDYLQYNYNFLINPGIALKNIESVKFFKFLKNILWQSSLQVFQKSISGDKRNLNPFNSYASDTSLLSFDRLQSHTISYNKLSQVWGLELNYLESSNRAFLSYGLETRSLRDLNLRLRSYWLKTFSLELVIRKKGNSLETPGFSNRNYAIQAFSFEPRISLVKGTDFRAQINYRAERKKSALAERGNIYSIGLDSRYNLFGKTAITAKVNHTAIRYQGVTNTSVSYLILEGLQPGKNYIWSLDLTRRIGDYIELSMQYEGRQMGVSKGIIHLGRAQFRALL